MVDPLLPSNSAAHMPEVRENCEMRNVLASPKPIISKRNKTLLAFQEKQELKSKLAIRGNESLCSGQLWFYSAPPQPQEPGFELENPIFGG